jgi:import inner membrane translocase subunit TIM13
MSWFGFGGGSDKKDAAPVLDRGAADSSFHYEAPHSSSFSEPTSSFGHSSGRSLQEEIQMEAQKIEIQQMLLQLTQMAFDKCVTKPGSSLSYSESSCIEASVGKYIDTKMFLANKLSGGH